MGRFIILFIAAVVLGGSLAAGQVTAQFDPGVQRPVVSPYLNLFRRGSSVANNYYNLVRPQIDTINYQHRLQQQVIDNRSAIVQQAQESTPGLPTTGRVAGYFTHRRYFMNRGGGGGTGSPPPPPVGGSFPSAGGVGFVPGVYESPRAPNGRR